MELHRDGTASQNKADNHRRVDMQERKKQMPTLAQKEWQRERL